MIQAEDPAASGRGSTAGTPSRRATVIRMWRVLRYFVGLGLGALAIDALLSRRGELSGATTYLTHVDWLWVLVAAVSEAGSYVAFASMQRRLLDAGGVYSGVGTMTGITLAATAIANSMPAGPAVASVYSFRRYRRLGADDVLSGWVIAGVFVATSVSLALFATIGVAIAGAEGGSLGLVGVVLGVFVASLVMGTVFLQRRALVKVVSAAIRVSRKIVGRPRGDHAAQVEALVSRIAAVRLSASQVVAIVGWAFGNWVLDCGCLALSFSALHVAVPWKGLMLAYGAGQLAANLPITPGGLGVVEGSLTIALVAYGGVEVSTVAAVLLYRVLSFWIELPVGWGTWGSMAWRSRRAEPSSERLESANDMEVVL